jgi:hypothetical protein
MGLGTRVRGTLAAGAAVVACSVACAPAGASGGAPDLKVAGNHFVAGGHITRLLGVNITGPEYGCVQPLFLDYYANGVWDYPVGNATVAAIAAWKVNAVRVPLNEDCWLGINPVHQGTAPAYKSTPYRGTGAAAYARRRAAHYRSEIRAFVARLHRHGLYAILDLHVTGPGSKVANEQYPLPDLDHSPAFWKSVATTFRHDRSTVFEIFNEPMLADANGTDTLSWPCLKNGCRLVNRCADCNDRTVHGHFRTAGFQLLVDTIRRTGARNPILVPGRWYSNDLSQWLRYEPHDPLHQLGATFHGYQLPPCHDISCWSTTLARVAARVPIATTEFGADNGSEPCADDISYDDALMRWADDAGVGYLAWVWWDLTGQYDQPRPQCSLGMLDSSESVGTPRPGHGQAVHDHFAALSAAEGGGRVS